MHSPKWVGLCSESKADSKASPSERPLTGGSFDAESFRHRLPWTAFAYHFISIVIQS